MSEKASDMAWHQANSDPEGVAASVTPAEAERSKDLEEGCEGDAVASGKLLRIKSIIALTGAGIDVSSASLSSREGEDGWVGEDRDGGLSKEASRDEARDDCCRRGEEESLEANVVVWERGNPSKRIPFALVKGNPWRRLPFAVERGSPWRRLPLSLGRESPLRRLPFALEKGTS